VNNAAVSVYGSCLDISSSDMARVLATNLWGTIHGSRVACRHLRVRGGALINVGSAVSDRAVPLQGIYSTSKHGIKAWTDALRVELAHEGAPIAVTLIKPAPIDTPYAEHAANYLPDQPVHLPPVYTPRSVARAILHAAEHPTRDVYVGSTARVLSLGSTLVPSLLDTVMERLFVSGTHSGRPRHGRSILYEPSNDLRERGEYPGLVRPSLYTAACRHYGLVGTSLAIAGYVAVELQRRSHTAHGRGHVGLRLPLGPLRTRSRDRDVPLPNPCHRARDKSSMAPATPRAMNPTGTSRRR
jgi:hypothetical protein